MNKILKGALYFFAAVAVVCILAAVSFSSEVDNSNKDITTVTEKGTELGTTEVNKTTENVIETTTDATTTEENIAIIEGDWKADIPAFDGSTPVAIVNFNKPFFKEEDMTTELFFSFDDLDKLGRCGIAFGCIDKSSLPTEERGEIGGVRPSGWHIEKYNDIIEGNYVYNRCHLLAYCLSGQNANEKNLITGTRYLNIDGMLPYELKLASYLKQNEDMHVLYRVTPVFENDNLVANGVLMEAISVEDAGNDICFCVYAYNVQPGVDINYVTGKTTYSGRFLEEARKAGAASVRELIAEAEDTSITTQEATTEASTDIHDYILNKNTRKFHYPYCSSVNDMAEHNKLPFDGTRDQVIAMGYKPCQRCNP